MSPQAFDKACLALPATALDHPFGPQDHVFKVGGKMFAVRGEGGGCSFKASEVAFAALLVAGNMRLQPQ